MEGTRLLNGLRVITPSQGRDIRKGAIIFPVGVRVNVRNVTTDATNAGRSGEELVLGALVRVPAER
jgi:hypothetical protein